MEINNKDENSFFTFNLSTGIFSVPVSYVKEVFEFTELTPVPNSLSYLKGVMNVRGSVVSVIDLRVLFGFKPSEDLSTTSVIVMEVPQEGEKPLELGIIADSVDVVSSLKMIQAGSANYGIPEEQKNFVTSVSRKGDQFILVLDLRSILEFIEGDVERHGPAVPDESEE